MKKMHRIHVAVLVVACAALAAATAMWACTPFSGTDSTGPADGGASADSGVSLNFDTCANGIHMTEGFEDAGFPPSPWRAMSYKIGDAGRDTTVVNSGNGSLKGSVVAYDAGVGGMIGFVLPITALPRAVRVRFAYKPVVTEFQGAFYAEVGCNVAFTTSKTNNAYLSYLSGVTAVEIGTASAPLAHLFDKDQWQRVSHVLFFDTAAGVGDAGVTLDTIVSEPDGGTSVSAHLNTSLSGTILPIQILCGIPYARSLGVSPLDAYVDDIAIDVCP